MDKQTMQRLGIVKIEKARATMGQADEMKIVVSRHTSNAISFSYSGEMADLIVGNHKENYINFGYSENENRLYMWGEKNSGFAITCSNSKNRVYTQSKSLAPIFNGVTLPLAYDVEFDALAKTHYINLKAGK